MTSLPRVSVIVAVYNGMAHLHSQMEALLAQECGFPWEVLYVDNGSRDGSQEEIKRRLALSPTVPIRLIDGTQKPGQVHARNVGAAAAAGEILVFTDQDDLPEKGWLAALVAGLESADAVGGFVQVTKHGEPPRPGERMPDAALPTYLGRFPVAIGTNFAIRKKVFLAVGGWQDVGVFAGEDVDISVRLQLAGFKLDYVPSARLTWRARLEPKAIFQQGITYGRSDVLLFQRYRHQGAVRPGLRLVLRSWRQLVQALIRFPFSPHRSLEVVHRLGWSLGRLRQSLASRTLYL